MSAPTEDELRGEHEHLRVRLLERASQLESDIKLLQLAIRDGKEREYWTSQVREGADSIEQSLFQVRWLERWLK